MRCENCDDTGWVESTDPIAIEIMGDDTREWCGKCDIAVTESYDIKWGNPVTFEQHGIAHLRTVSAEDSSQVALQLGVDPPIQRCFWAKLEPGGFIAPHIDAGPYWDRWHVPVQPAGVFWQNGVEIHPEPFEPFRVKHWENHAVWNDTDVVRVHLIVDRAEEPGERPVYSPLVVCEMIPEIEALVP